MTTTSNANTTFSPTTQEILLDASLFPPGVHYTIVTLYVLVTCFGICANCMVLYLFASKKIKFTSFNLLLLNLSVADLLADIFSYPYIFAGIDLSPLRNLSSKMADVSCAFTIGLTPFWTVTTVSLFTLTFISLTRCLKIRYPMRCEWITTRRCTIIYIVFAWIAGIGLPSPNFFSFKFVRKTAVCDRSYPEGFHSGIYRIGIALISFAIPITLMLSAFLLVAFSLWKKSKILGETTPLPDSSLAKRRNAVKLLGALIIVFFICWSPFFTYFLLSGIITSKFRGKNLANKIICGTILFALCNSAADPVVYALKGDEFRKAFQATLRQFASTGFGRKLLSVLCCRKQHDTDMEMTEKEGHSTGTLFGTPIGTPRGSPRGTPQPTPSSSPLPQHRTYLIKGR